MTPNQLRELISAAFGSSAHPLASWYATLLAARSGLREFTATHASKIKKKARQATDADALRDLRCELAVAASLADRRSTLSYEPLAASNRRGPDFLLRYKGHTPVYIEVSRLRPASGERRNSADRLAAVLCGKLDQLVSGAANVLVLIRDDAPADAAEFAAIIQGLRRRADAQDNPFFAYRGVDGARAFLHRLPRLSATLLCSPTESTDVLYITPHARHPLPADLVRTMDAWQLGTLIGDGGDVVEAGG